MSHQTIAHLAHRFGLDLTQRSPIEIQNIGRDGFAQVLGELGFTSGAEIGVERGLYSEVLCRSIPGLRLLCVDAWQAYRGYRDHVDQAKLEAFYEETRDRLAPFAGATIARAFSLDAVRTVPDGSLDFVYIDGNHSLQHCINDLAEWSKKVRPGGIIAGHDFVRYKLPNQIQVVQAVTAWTDANEIQPWFVLGRQAKVPGEIRDTARSFLWVHEPRPLTPRGRRPVKQ